MTTQAATTHNQPCPGCDQVDRVDWVTSTPNADTWTCAGCGAEWTITVHALGVAR